MVNWTNKQWGVVIGVLAVLAIALVGAGITALAVLAGIAGYFVGKFLDGELDLEEIRARAQARARGQTYEPSSNGASATTGPMNDLTQQQPPASSPVPSVTGSGGTRVR